MSYKPFENINLVTNYYDKAAKGSRNAFLQLETLLKALELPECDTLQVKNIALNDAVQITDDGTLIVSAPKYDYALVCTGTPGAAGTSPHWLGLDSGVLTLMLTMRIDDPDFEAGILYRRYKSTPATILEFGINGDHKFYVTVNATTVMSDVTFQDVLENELGGSSAGWHDFGMQMNDSGGVIFYADGRTTAVTPLIPFGQPDPTTDLIEIGCAGVSIARLQLRKHGSWGLLTPEVNHFDFPLPLRRLPNAINYYDFRVSALTPTTIPDLSVVNYYKTDLTLNEDNAALEVVEII